MPFTYDYPRPALTVDIILFNKTETRIEVLLIKRDKPPYEGKWALPGGFVDMDESVETAAIRELEEETSIQLETLQQFYVFDAINRDPRGRTISVVHYAITENLKQNPKASSDARNARFFDVKRLPDLAFDHNHIIRKAMEEILSWKP